MNEINVLFAGESHICYADRIAEIIVEAPKDGIVGFSYIESWTHGEYVAMSGLIVDSRCRRMDIAERNAKTR